VALELPDGVFADVGQALAQAGAGAGIPPRPGRRFRSPPATSAVRDHQLPVFGIEAQGSRGGSGSPFCSSSIEMLSGERTKAMCPSRGGRLMVTPKDCSRSQVA